MGFEQLEVWKRSSKLCTEIYKHFNNFKDFGFRDQITRSSLSIPSNIAEGEEKGYHKRKYTIFDICSGVLRGTQNANKYIGSDIGYIENDIASYWIQETKEISAMIVGLIKSKKSEP